jgi:hypothetical protein
MADKILTLVAWLKKDEGLTHHSQQLKTAGIPTESAMRYWRTLKCPVSR